MLKPKEDGGESIIAGSRTKIAYVMLSHARVPEWPS